MAHLRKIDDLLCRLCDKRRASVELFNNRNATHGKFCLQCGMRELRELKRLENAEVSKNERGQI
jgi:hypothetical protein